SIKLRSIVQGSLFTFFSVPEYQMQWLRRMNSLLKLLLQRALGFGRHPGFCCSLSGKLRKHRQFTLKILSGDSVPQTVFEREDVHLFLIDTQNLSVRDLNNCFFGTNIDRQVLLQIEAGFRDERSMQFYAFGAAYPGVEEFMFNFDPS